MSRSRRKTLIFGHAICRSERKDKQLWHRRWRAGERTLLASASPEALSAHLPLSESQVSDVYWMGKDGRSYWPIARQVAMAKRVALKKRLLRKWMGKRAYPNRSAGQRLGADRRRSGILKRNLIYTGVTHGKRLVVLVGQKRALAIAVKGQHSERRCSKLSE